MKSCAVLLILSGVVCLIHSASKALSPDSLSGTGLVSMTEHPVVLLFPLLSAILISAGTALLAWLEASGRDRWA